MKGEKSSQLEKNSGKFQIPIKDLALLRRIPFTYETEQSKVEIALRERIKELNCLYGISQLAQRHSDSIEDFLADLVNFLPHAWQFPEITCAQVRFREQVFKGKGFRRTKWLQSSQIFLYNEPVGEIEIVYTKECPPSDEGPFLKEERALLDELAEQIGHIAARIYAEKELQEINKQLTVERKALQETNTALKMVMARIEEEKQEIYINISTNVEKILMPILHTLALELAAPKKKYAEMIRSGLEEITSPFIKHLSQSHYSLTTTEISICNMIRIGMRTKEIAQIKGITEATVNRHRENIRRKLKITNSEVNLVTFLQQNMWDGKASQIIEK